MAIESECAARTDWNNLVKISTLASDLAFSSLDAALLLVSIKNRTDLWAGPTLYEYSAQAQKIRSG